MHKKTKLISSKFREFCPWLVAAITVLSANLASNILWETFAVFTGRKDGNIAFWGVFLCLAFFMFMVKVLSRQKGFFPPRTRYLSNKDAERRKHLFLFLSTISPKIERTNGIPDNIELLFSTIAEDLEIIRKAKDNKIWWKWEMPLRAINHHLGMLETTTLICSKESLKQVYLFLNICLKYNELNDVDFYLLLQKEGNPKHLDTAFVNHVTDFKYEDFINYEGLDFESFDELTEAFLYLISKYKNAEKDIMIDITGGKKPTSIVGASVTFNQKIKAQYIQTEDENRALSYDVILAPRYTGGFGT
jgi:hypothetical protein